MMERLMQMMTKRKRKYLGARLLLIAIFLSALTSGCVLSGLHKGTQDLTRNIPKEEVETVDIMGSPYRSINPRKELTEFSPELLSENLSHDNCLVSPLSIVSALGMTANGVEGNTRAQAEQMMHTGTAVLNGYLKAYTDYIPSSKACQVNIASSIQLRDKDSLAINEDLLRASRNYYDASIFEAPFDAGIRDDINNWVKRETNGMIQKLLEEVPPRDVVMYLVNVLSFDGEWWGIYKKNQIHKGAFNTENGEHRSAEFMYSTEAVYLENTLGGGFLKPYGGGTYALVAVLPDEGMMMRGFLERLRENGITNFLERAHNKAVCIRLPKFTMEYNVVLDEFLTESGVKDAFDSQKADFSSMAHSDNNSIYISKVIHKIKIDVNEKGTKAGAATAVEVSEGNAVQTEGPKEIFLDRPFFYVVIDTRQNFPLFMGYLMQLE